MDNTISNKAVLILVIVAVVLSIVSTTLVLNATYSVEPSGDGESAPSGRVSLSVPTAPVSGHVTFHVPLEETE